MILITGATGLVGRYVSKSLLDEKIPFKALKRETSVIPAILKDHPEYDLIRWVEGDILDMVGLEDIFEEVDIVIHCAAIISFHPPEYKQMWETNVRGTINMVDQSLNKKVKKFIHLSSIAALGRDIKTPVIDESTHWTKSVYNSYYAETKHMAELEVWRGYEEGLPIIILNPSTVLGPGEWETGTTRIFKYVWNENKYYPTGTLNCVDVRDVADIIIRMINTEKTGQRFLLNGGKISFKSFLESIAVNLNKEAPDKEVKGWTLKFLLFSAWARSQVFNKKPLITTETVRLSQLDFDYRNDKIKSFLNFDFIPIEDTIVWVCKELLAKQSSLK